MEVAYKMFNSDLTCTMGRGTFQYEPGRWYEEDAANIRKNGFHAAKNPLDCLSYYHDFQKSQAWLCHVDGEIDEDSRDSAITAQRIMLVKRMTLAQFVAASALYIMQHPHLEYNSNVTAGPATANANHFAVSVGRNARAKGQRGDVLAVLRTHPDSRAIETAGLFEIDGENYYPDIWYDADGNEVFGDDQEE